MTTGAPHSFQIVRFALGLILVTAAIWGFCAWLLMKGVPPDRYLISEVTAAPVENPDFPIPSPLFQQTALPASMKVPEPHVVFRHLFTPRPGETPYSVFLPAVRDNAAVYLNGTFVAARGAVQNRASYFGYYPLVFDLPEALVRPGENTLDIAVIRNQPFTAKDLSAFYLGPHGMMHTAWSWRNVLQVETAKAATYVLGFISLLCLAIAPLSNERRLLTALAVFLGLWCLRNFHNLCAYFEGPPQWRAMWYFAVTYGLLLSGVVLFNLWTGGSRAPRRIAIWTGFTVVPVVCVLIWLYPVAGQRLGIDTERLIGSLALLYIGFRLYAYYRLAVLSKLWEATALVFCLTVAVFDFLTPFLFDRPGFLLPPVGVILALALLTSLSARTASVMRTAMALNEHLNQRVMEKEREIQESYARLHTEEQERTLAEERQRLMRDMHDGMGGQVLSLLLRMRRDDIGRDQIIRALEDSLQDLRLMIDSLDSVGDSLDMALGAFRHRIDPSLRAANIDLTWKAASGAPFAGGDPQAVLHIYRILQEAFTNVLRHSEATQAELRTDYRQEDDLPIVISLTDNGIGMADPARAGKGIRNMRTRAQKLGGVLEITPSTPGTKVTLLLPGRSDSTNIVS